jgi:endonuclease G
MLVPRDLIEKAIRDLDWDPEKVRRETRDKVPRLLEREERLAQWFRLNRAANPREAGVLFERIINGNDLTGIATLERGLRVSKSVGRIHVRDSSGGTLGYGTGFLIAPGVLMTNHHVLGTASAAAASLFELDYEHDAEGLERDASQYALEPDRLFYAREDLDFAVVAVAPRARDDARSLSDFSWLRLVADPGKALLGSYLTIIQHPGGQRKQICVRENQLIRMDEKVVWYATDTLGGSSGSPVFNDNWQVVALHHLGVPKRDAKGNWLTIDGRVFDAASMDESRIQWIANEGVRISRIVATLARERGEHRLLQPLFNGATPPEPVLRSDRRTRPEIAVGSTGVEPMTLQVPIEITVRLRPSGGGPEAGLPSVSLAGRAPEAEEKISIDPDYGNRRGFDEEFLGGGALATPLPSLDARRGKDVALLTRPEGKNRYVLRYHHFSVVMNARRRVAFFTAVNIDGGDSRKIEREKDAWYLDPRIPPEAQTDNDLYASNPLDRGHLVRRLDPAWGSPRVAKIANDDTFHFTNCSPQHEEFNQRQTRWAGLEDYILTNASREKFRVNVFTGPVFAKNDPVYRDVALPKQYWKVVAMVRPDGELSATGYLLSQASLLQDLEAEFTYGAYRTYQVPIRRIEKITGLRFGRLAKHDPMGEAVEAAAPREITLYTDVRL